MLLKITIDKRKIRYSFSFDSDIEKLEIYTGSKTKPYYEIRRYLTLELKFTHLKDTDYISDKLIFSQDSLCPFFEKRYNLNFDKLKSLRTQRMIYSLFSI
jgi:hypothetical protein